MVTVTYRSYPQKRKAYVQHTLPAIFAMALAGSLESNKALESWMSRNRVTRANFDYQPVLTLQKLHEAVRRERYVRETLPQDNVQPISQTLQYGGDCEDYAVLLFAALAKLHVSAHIETSGDLQDPFMHVYVAAMYAGSRFILDPKGDQNGAEFDQHSETNPVRIAFKIGRDGHMIEVPRG